MAVIQIWWMRRRKVHGTRGLRRLHPGSRPMYHPESSKRNAAPRRSCDPRTALNVPAAHTFQHPSIDRNVFVQPQKQPLQCQFPSQNHTPIKSSRSTKWYVPCFTNCLFTSSILAPQQHRSLLTDAKGRRRPARRLGSPPLEFQESPLLLQRITKAVTMGTTARNRYRETQDLHGRAPQCA